MRYARRERGGENQFQIRSFWQLAKCSARTEYVVSYG